MITRFAVLPDERKLLMGLDKLGLFEPGYVYEAYEMLDEIVIRKVGKYALSKGEEYRDANGIISEMFYKMLMTEKEITDAVKNERESKRKD